jgi:hypothetical protein
MKYTNVKKGVCQMEKVKGKEKIKYQKDKKDKKRNRKEA